MAEQSIAHEERQGGRGGGKRLNLFQLLRVSRRVRARYSSVDLSSGNEFTYEGKSCNSSGGQWTKRRWFEFKASLRIIPSFELNRLFLLLLFVGGLLCIVFKENFRNDRSIIDNWLNEFLFSFPFFFFSYIRLVTMDRK